MITDNNETIPTNAPSYSNSSHNGNDDRDAIQQEADPSSFSSSAASTSTSTKELLQLLASSALDSWSPKIRRSTVLDVTTFIITNKMARQYLATSGTSAINNNESSNNLDHILSKCVSTHAYIRLCQLFVRALVVQIEECSTATTAKNIESGKQTRKSNDLPDFVHQQMSDSNETLTTMKTSVDTVASGIANALCQLVIRHAQYSSKTEQQHERHDNAVVVVNKPYYWKKEAAAKTVTIANTTRNEKIKKKKQERLIRICARELDIWLLRKHNRYTRDFKSIQQCVDAFLFVVAHAAQCNSYENRGRYAPALALIHHLISAVTFIPTPVSSLFPCNTNKKKKLTANTPIKNDCATNDDKATTTTAAKVALIRKEIMDIMIKRFFDAPGKFATVWEISCCEALLSSLTRPSNQLHEYDGENLFKTMGIKLRANPESVMATASEIIRVMGVNCVAQRSSGSAEGIEDGKHCFSMKRLLEGDAKLLVSSMKQLRSAKEDLRDGAIIMLSGMVAIDPTCGSTIINEILESLKGKGAAAALSSPDQRIAAYISLKSIAETMDVCKLHFLSDETLEVLAHSVGKENSDAAKEFGCSAISSWISLSITADETNLKGFKSAMNFFSSPVVSKSLGKEFRVRLSIIMTNPIINLHGLEMKVVSLLIATNGEVEQGLNSIVDAAVKKHGGSASMLTATVPQVDGLIATYLLLLKGMDGAPLSPSVLTPLESSTSFLYCPSVTKLCSDSVVRLLPKCVAMYFKMSKITLDIDGNLAKIDGMVRALALCVINKFHHSVRAAALCSLDIVLSLGDSVNCGILVHQYSEVMLRVVNERSVQRQEELRFGIVEREQREAVDPIDERSPSLTESRNYIYDKDVRHAAKIMIKYTRQTSETRVFFESLSRILILSHIGTTTKTSRAQRFALTKHTEDDLQMMFGQEIEPPPDYAIEFDRVADFIAASACHGDSEVGDKLKKMESNEENVAKDSDKLGSLAIHNASCGVISTLIHMSSACVVEMEEGLIGQPYRSFSNSVVQLNLPAILAKHVSNCTNLVESLSESDMVLFHSPECKLLEEASYYTSSSINGGEPPKTSNAAKKRPAKSRRQKGDFGAGFEEEEWERQMKEEIKQKREIDEVSSKGSGGRALSPQQQALLAEQASRRHHIRRLLQEEWPRSLHAVTTLCGSDIVAGNKALPTVASSVILAATSSCPAILSLPVMADVASFALLSLAGCVFEIDEEKAPNIVEALQICFSDSKENKKNRDARNFLSYVTPLPVPCYNAAAVLSEIADTRGHLSGSSFYLIFPIVKAALMGPRTVPGCESALRVLDRQIELLIENNSLMFDLRRDMVLAVLELLCHDRCQTFHGPTPYEVLENLFHAECPKPLSAEIAPLLGRHGALGGTHSRIASMMALAMISKGHFSALQGNPLVENRIWMNCFSADDAIKIAAIRAWKFFTSDTDAIQEGASLAPPSKIYAVALLPLLSNDDQSISSAASEALAFAMGMHSDTCHRTILRMCESYIEVFPTSLAEETAQASKPLAEKAVTAVSSKSSLSQKVFKSSHAKTSLLKKPSSVRVKKMSKLPVATKAMNEEQLKSQFLPSASKRENADKDSAEKLKIRGGILGAISSMGRPAAHILLGIDSLIVLVGFLMAYANAEANDKLCTTARNTATDVVAVHAGSNEAIAFVLPFIEALLGKGLMDEKCLKGLPTDKIPRGISASDRRKEGAVVVLGSVALHLDGSEHLGKIDSTVDMLIATLKTPSEDVQASVAISMSKLMKKGRTPERVQSILSEMMQNCIHGSSLATRRGSAYGVSAVVKGSGIACLKKYDIVRQLEEACKDSQPNGKEGALFAVELLCDSLGLLFEPYIIVLLPALLKAFSDSNDYVRNAAGNTASVIMSRLSAHGVKLVMPAVLSAFDEPEWRTKQASIQMLGSMSHCAPKQLASALPKVVPKLTEAFSDTHAKVKASAEQALNEICRVIKNPEIAELSATLLTALLDPANETKRALEALIETEFLHAIDAPSLAIIVPVLYRGLRDRGASAKRYSALIAGNMCTMINDPRDFSPYLPTLLPCLKAVLLDPIPDVRSTAAKALGLLTRGLGEDALPGLRSWLVDTLTGQDGGSVERSGAAQGLTEVITAGGFEMVEKVMVEDILPFKSHPKPNTREGVLWILCFLPSAIGQAFAPLIDLSLPALLRGLSDDSEPVRDVAMRAGRVLIKTHGKTHLDKILPSLEVGLSDDDWRIRLSSLTLLGDLLSTIGGTKVAKGEADTQEDIRQAERAQAQIALVLGAEIRKRVLSRLYLARSDTASVVRQAAIQVWKTVVSVTGRTLRDILSVLVQHIVFFLASSNSDQTEVGGRCLGDIVVKLGDNVLPEIIPVLRDGFYRGDKQTKKGVCVGLSEVIACSSKEHINRFLKIIVKAVQDALCDEDAGVREMAADCFQSLYNVIGTTALDEVVPVLFAALRDSDDYHDDAARARAIYGLTGILSIRSRELLPMLLPRLLDKPLSTSHANALGAISEVTGSTLYLHFHSIIPTLISELAGLEGSDDGAEMSREEVLRGCTKRLFANVGTEGLNSLVSEIARKCSSDKPNWRQNSCWMFGVLCEARKEQADFYDLLPILLRELLYRLNDDSKDVLRATNEALASLTDNVPAEVLVNHVEFCRNLIASIVSDARRRKGGVGDAEFLLPGFNMSKGLEPLHPIFQRGILYGSASVREASASGLGELISLTDSKYLAGPFIIKVTGPLLRIVGDRNPSPVKIAIIQTLGLVLKKGGPTLRAFVPQFQTTFVKALSDPSRQVRVQAIRSLGLLMPLTTRVDPLIKELVSGSLGRGSITAPVATGDEAGVVTVQTATIVALATVLTHGGTKAKLDDSIPSAIDAGKQLLFHTDEGIRDGAAQVLGAACNLLGVDATAKVVQYIVSPSKSPNNSPEAKHGKASAIYRILVTSVDVSQDSFLQMTNIIQSLMNDNSPQVKNAACVAAGAVLGAASSTKGILSEFEKIILTCMDETQSMELHKSLARGLCTAVNMKPCIFRDKTGLPIMDGALRLAMSGNQRVQLAFNDFLWLALAASEGDDGMENYAAVASFENEKSMRALASKVLSRMKRVNLDDSSIGA